MFQHHEGSYLPRDIYLGSSEIGLFLEARGLVELAVTLDLRLWGWDDRKEVEKRARTKEAVLKTISFVTLSCRSSQIYHQINDLSNQGDQSLPLIKQ